MRARARLLVAVVLALLAGCGDEPPTAFQLDVEAYFHPSQAGRDSTWDTLDKLPRTLDVAGRRSYEWAKRPPDILGDAGPYLLHILLERRDDADARADAIAVIARVETGAKRLQELLLGGTFHASGCDATTRRLLAQALATFPRSEVNTKRAKQALAEAVRARDDVLCRYLLEVVSRSASPLPEPDRAQIVNAIHSLEALDELVGERYRFQRIALIGGKRASEIVLAYLNAKKDARENRWAADVAGRLEWSNILETWLRQAMKGAPPVFSDAAVTRRQAVNACRDLVARFAKEQEDDPMARKHLGDISRMLTNLEQEGIGFDQDAHLGAAHARLRQELADALE